MTVRVQMGMADPRERRSAHGLMVAAVAVMVTAGLLRVNFFDHPYRPHTGSIQPTQMRQSLTAIQQLQPSSTPAYAAYGSPRPAN